MYNYSKHETERFNFCLSLVRRAIKLGFIEDVGGDMYSIRLQNGYGIITHEAAAARLAEAPEILERFQDEDAPHPVGRIEYIAPDGRVGEVLVFTEAGSFVDAVADDSFYGIPANVVIYGEGKLDENEIYKRILAHKEFSVHFGLHIEMEA